MKNKREYMYSFDPKWDQQWANQFITDEWTGYHQAAEMICEESDCNSAEYPDEQAVWVLDKTHTVPRRFVVYAEMRRYYSAIEILEESCVNSAKDSQ